jgi:hypothetical protein
MILVFEIALFVGGIVVLVRGKMDFSRGKVTSGGPAYAAGTIMVVTPPLALGAGFGYLLSKGGRNWMAGVLQDDGLPDLIEGGIAVVGFIAAMLISALNAKPPQEGKRRRGDWDDIEDYEDDEDRRPRKARRRDDDDDDDDDDDEDRRSRRRRDADAEEDDQPRRPRPRPPASERDERVRSDRPPRRRDDEE